MLILKTLTIISHMYATLSEKRPGMSWWCWRFLGSKNHKEYYWHYWFISILNKFLIKKASSKLFHIIQALHLYTS